MIFSKPASEIPGDTSRELLSPAQDQDGALWPVATVFQPLCGGHDNTKDDTYATLMIGGATHTFFAADQPKKRN